MVYGVFIFIDILFLSVFWTIGVCFLSKRIFCRLGCEINWTQLPISTVPWLPWDGFFFPFPFLSVRFLFSELTIGTSQGNTFPISIQFPHATTNFKISAWYISSLQRRKYFKKIDERQYIRAILCNIYIIILPGPPEITLDHGSTDTFSLLPPDTNRAEVEVLTQNVALSTNLVGRWHIPDGSIVTHNSLTFTIFHQSNEGLYRFYVTDWNGEFTLAIQVSLSIVGMLFEIYLSNIHNEHM